MIDKTIETFNNFFSIIFFIAEPKFPIRKAIIKNLEPLVIKETIIKYDKLKVSMVLSIILIIFAYLIYKLLVNFIS